MNMSGLALIGTVLLPSATADPAARTARHTTLPSGVLPWLAINALGSSLLSPGVLVSSSRTILLAFQISATRRAGGIAFDTPDTREPSVADIGDLVFTLHGSKADIEEEEFTRKVQFVMYFTGSVRGLNPGAPLEFRGIRIGQVLIVTVGTSVSPLRDGWRFEAARRRCPLDDYLRPSVHASRANP